MSKKKKKGTKGSENGKRVEEIKLDPEVEAFVNWFADWWLRRGRRLVKAAKEADPDFGKKRKRSNRDDLPPFYWDDENQRFVLEREENARS
jgi:hypothetical protein